MTSPLVLLVLALLLRLLPLRADPREPWSTPVDLGLALGLGAATAAAKAWYLALFAMTDGTDVFDLPDVCMTVEALLSWDLPSVVRQPVAALLPAALYYPLGLFDGVAAGSLISAAALGAALYLWGRALFGRAAGVAAAVFSCAINPLVVMTRQMTFYPESVAAFGLCAAGAAAALRWRNLPALGLAGAGIGLALAAEHSGLIFALIPSGLALAVALRAPRRRVPLRLAVLLAPILLSWIGARLVTPPGMRSFEDKVATYTVDNVGHPLTNPFAVKNLDDGSLLMTLRRWVYPRDLFRHNRFEPRQGYHWGRSGPLGMARALATVALLSREEPTDEVRSIAEGRWDTSKNRAGLFSPWVPVALACLALTVLALWRRWWELAGLLAMLAPFAALLAHTTSNQVISKTLMAPMMPIPVVLGVAWAALALRGPNGRLLPAPLRRLVPKPGASTEAATTRPPKALCAAAWLLPGAVAALLVLGVVPGWLAPNAPWRIRAASDSDFYNVQAFGAAKGLGLPPPVTSKPKRESCETLFAADAKRGIPSISRLYPKERFERRWDALCAPGRDQKKHTPPPPPRQGIPKGDLTEHPPRVPPPRQ